MNKHEDFESLLSSKQSLCIVLYTFSNLKPRILVGKKRSVLVQYDKKKAGEMRYLLQTFITN